mgnify:CR=1 FL=1
MHNQPPGEGGISPHFKSLQGHSEPWRLCNRIWWRLEVLIWVGGCDHLCRKVDGILVPYTAFTLIELHCKIIYTVDSRGFLGVVVCSEFLAHSPSQCQTSPQCINYNGLHSFNSRECPKLIMVREIQKIWATERVSLPEACYKHQTQHPIGFSHSFPEIVKPSNAIQLGRQIWYQNIVCIAR